MTPGEVFEQEVQRRAARELERLVTELRAKANDLADEAGLGFHGLDLLAASVSCTTTSQAYCLQRASETIATRASRKLLQELTP